MHDIRAIQSEFPLLLNLLDYFLQRTKRRLSRAARCGTMRAVQSHGLFVPGDPFCWYREGSVSGEGSSG